MKRKGAKVDWLISIIFSTDQTFVFEGKWQNLVCTFAIVYAKCNYILRSFGLIYMTCSLI